MRYQLILSYGLDYFGIGSDFRYGESLAYTTSIPSGEHVKITAYRDRHLVCHSGLPIHWLLGPIVLVLETKFRFHYSHTTATSSVYKTRYTFLNKKLSQRSDCGVLSIPEDFILLSPYSNVPVHLYRLLSSYFITGLLLIHTI